MKIRLQARLRTPIAYALVMISLCMLLPGLSALAQQTSISNAPLKMSAVMQPRDAYRDWSALRVMRETQRRHEQFPYVYEEQTMVLMDAQSHRSVRRSRRFSRTEADGTAKFLLVLDDPQEIRGVALLAIKHVNGEVERGVYLPAYGAQFKRPPKSSNSGHFLGTDFSVEDLTTESLAEHRYVRVDDLIRGKMAYFVIDAYPANQQLERESGYGRRRHLIWQDNFMIVQSDFYDRQQRFKKTIAHHDLKRVSGESWRANMIVANNKREHHQTLLKIDRRIYSRDYVPEILFEHNFLLNNGHMNALSDRIAGRLPWGSKPSASSNK